MWGFEKVLKNVDQLINKLYNVLKYKSGAVEKKKLARLITWRSVVLS